MKFGRSAALVGAGTASVVYAAKTDPLCVGWEALTGYTSSDTAVADSVIFRNECQNTPKTQAKDGSTDPETMSGPDNGAEYGLAGFKSNGYMWTESELSADANKAICTDAGGTFSTSNTCAWAFNENGGAATNPYGSNRRWDTIWRGAKCCGGSQAWKDACTQYGSATADLTDANRDIYEAKMAKFECECDDDASGSRDQDRFSCVTLHADGSGFENLFNKKAAAASTSMLSVANQNKCYDWTPGSGMRRNKLEMKTCGAWAVECLTEDSQSDREECQEEMGQAGCCPPDPTLITSGSGSIEYYSDSTCSTAATHPGYGTNKIEFTFGSSTKDCKSKPDAETDDNNGVEFSTGWFSPMYTWYPVSCNSKGIQIKVYSGDVNCATDTMASCVSSTCAAGATSTCVAGVAHNSDCSVGASTVGHAFDHAFSGFPLKPLAEACVALEEWDENGNKVNLYAVQRCSDTVPTSVAAPAPIEQTLAAEFNIPDNATPTSLLADTTFTGAISAAIAGQLTGVVAADITITAIRFVSRRARSLAVDQKLEIDYTVAVDDATEAAAVTTFGSSATTAQLTAMQNSIATTLTSAGSAISSGTVTGVTTAEEDEDSDSAAFVGAKVSAFVAGFAGIAAAMTLF
jgi:hypothetical protein